MSSPSRYKSSSPVRHLDEKYYSKPLQTILEQNNAAMRLSNSLIYQNQYLQKENERLISQFARSKEGQTYHYTENAKLKKEREEIQNNIRSIQARSIAERDIKERQLESQQRQIRLIKEEYGRENVALREQIGNLSNKIHIIESNKKQQLDDLKRKFVSNSLEETQFLKRNLSEQLRKVIGQLQVTRQILNEKERQNLHLIAMSQQNAAEYSASLENLISENNILRNQLIGLEMDKNKEIQHAENKKQLEKSRTIGILSYVKENSHFMERQLTRLAEQLLQKNISIESFTKELLKQKKQSENNQKRYEEIIAKIKNDYDQKLRQKDQEISKQQKYHKQDITTLKSSEMHLQEELSSKQNQLDNIQRELNHYKEQLNIRDRQIQQLKDGLNRMHEDHSKELSKVMLDSKVKRRSGLNISSYSSSSLKDLEEAQGSSIIKTHGLDRKNSSHQVGSGGLPVVKEQLAMSHGQIDDEQEDIQIKQLILHYESMIDELKKNKLNEIELANQKIESLKSALQQKQQEIIQILNRFSPLVELKVNRASLQQERRAKIEQSQKADVAILQVLLEKYQIVSLRPKKK